MRIDAHHHLWQIDTDGLDWLEESQYDVIRRNYGFDELRPHLEAHGIGATVLVQAATTVTETRWMLAQAARHDAIRGVIGWVDLDDHQTPEVLAALATDPRLVGVRPDLPRNVHSGPLTAAAKASLETLESLGLVLEFYCPPDRLPTVREIALARPGLQVVLDHGGYPELGGDDLEPWSSEMSALARATGCAVKFSGMLWDLPPHWHDSLLERAFDHLLDSFGPHRLIWGSDWPHVEAHGSYGEWVEISGRYLARLSDSERATIYGGTAARVLRLGA